MSAAKTIARAASLVGMYWFWILIASWLALRIGRIPLLGWALLALCLIGLWYSVRLDALTGSLQRRWQRVLVLSIGHLPALLPAIAALAMFAGLVAQVDAIVFYLQWLTAWWLPLVVLVPTDPLAGHPIYLWLSALLPLAQLAFVLAVGWTRAPACSRVEDPPTPVA
ncbi:MAG: hypothetical protein ACOCYP_03670 [Planctomycetota bacterium]